VNKPRHAGSGKRKKKLKTLKSVMAKKDLIKLLDKPVFIKKDTQENSFISPVSDWKLYDDLLYQLKKNGKYFNNKRDNPLISFDYMSWQLPNFRRIDELVVDLFSSGRYLEFTEEIISEIYYSNVPEYPNLKLAKFTYLNDSGLLGIASRNQVTSLPELDFVASKVYKRYFSKFGLNMLFQDHKNGPYFGLLIPIVTDKERIYEFSRDEKISRPLKTQIKQLYSYMNLIIFDRQSHKSSMMFHDGYYTYPTLERALTGIVNSWGKPR